MTGPSDGDRRSTLAHDLRGPVITIDGFTAEIEHALDELDALLDQSAGTGELVERLRELLAEDLRPCLGFVGEATRQLHTRIEKLCPPAGHAET